MAAFKDIIEGMQILSKYTTDKYATGAEHDIVYVFVDHDTPSQEDQDKLQELGWIKDSAGSWAVFT